MLTNRQLSQNIHPSRYSSAYELSIEAWNFGNNRTKPDSFQFINPVPVRFYTELLKFLPQDVQIQELFEAKNTK